MSRPHTPRLPLYLGSGITPENLAECYALTDGFIVGSAFEVDGRWAGAVNTRRVERFMVRPRAVRSMSRIRAATAHVEVRNGINESPDSVIAVGASIASAPAVGLEPTTP